MPLLSEQGDESQDIPGDFLTVGGLGPHSGNLQLPPRMVNEGCHGGCYPLQTALHDAHAQVVEHLGVRAVGEL